MFIEPSIWPLEYSDGVLTSINVTFGWLSIVSASDGCNEGASFEMHPDRRRAIVNIASFLSFIRVQRLMLCVILARQPGIFRPSLSGRLP